MKRKKRHELQVAALANAMYEVVQFARDCPDVPMEEFLGMLEMFVLAVKLDMLESLPFNEEE